MAGFHSVARLSGILNVTCRVGRLLGFISELTLFATLLANQGISGFDEDLISLSFFTGSKMEQDQSELD